MHAMHFEVWRTLILILDSHRPDPSHHCIRDRDASHDAGTSGMRARERETHIKFSLSYRRGTATTLSFRLL